MRLSANLSFLFPDLPFLDRFEAAAAAGFRGVEFMFPYEYAADDIARRLERHRLELVLFNLPAGDWAAGERGIGCLPGREAEFRRGVGQALALAKIFGTRRLNALAGIAPSGTEANTDNAVLAATFVGNLRAAAALLEADGAPIRLLIEPINSRLDIPGFWLDTPAKAMEIVRQVGPARLGLQFDVYHAQVMTGDLARQIEAMLPCIGHMQIADHPGRHQPGTGEINYPYLFGRLDALGYAGWVGCEFRPQGGMRAALEWAAPWLV